MMAGMSEPQLASARPVFTLGWRLRLALETASIKAKEMAAELDMDEGTISRWCHDVGKPPRSIYLRHWADRCQVPYEWLARGAEQARGGDGAYGVEGLPLCAVIDHSGWGYWPPGPHRPGSRKTAVSRPDLHTVGVTETTHLPKAGSELRAVLDAHPIAKPATRMKP